MHVNNNCISNNFGDRDLLFFGLSFYFIVNKIILESGSGNCLKFFLATHCPTLKSPVMKKINLLFASLLLLSAFVLSSCDKDDPDNAVTVEYKITPMNPHFTNIEYTDANGNFVDVTDWEQFVDGKRSITVVKPFPARIKTNIVNTTTETLYYDLVISVNGEPKQVVSATAPPQSNSMAVAEYSVK